MTSGNKMKKLTKIGFFISVIPHFLRENGLFFIGKKGGVQA